ENQLVNRTMT
ncbi:hypothetical protein ACTA71_011792, partial [Dictyostelium dimigraforme]